MRSASALFLAFVLVSSSFGCVSSGNGGDKAGSGFGASGGTGESGGAGAADGAEAGSAGQQDGAGSGGQDGVGSGGDGNGGETGGPVTAGSGGTSGTGGTGGTSGTGGTGGSGGTAGTGGSTASDSGSAASDSGADGACCSDGDCLCHGPDPTALPSTNGPFDIAEYAIPPSTTQYPPEYATPACTVHYPTDAEPPFAAIAVSTMSAVTGGIGLPMTDWGTFFASWGMVLAIVEGSALHMPDRRASDMLVAIELLKAENTNTDSPLSGKLSDRYGVGGWQIAGAASWIAAAQDASLKTCMTLAGLAMSPAPDEILIAGGSIQVPTMIMHGSAVPPTSEEYVLSQQAYDAIADTTAKFLLEIEGLAFLDTVWFAPAQEGGNTIGQYALAFHKVFLEGDERWKPLLQVRPDNASDWRMNIP